MWMCSYWNFLSGCLDSLSNGPDVRTVCLTALKARYTLSECVWPNTSERVHLPSVDLAANMNEHVWSCLFSIRQCLLNRIYTFVLVPRLATCMNIRMPLSLREWTVFTCVTTFTCLYTLTRMNCSRRLFPLTRVQKPLGLRPPRMARQICDWYIRRSPCCSPCHSRECVNAVSGRR